MAATNKLSLRTLVLFTSVPAMLIGALIWGVTGILPACSSTESARLVSPDGAFDLVVFSRSCGADTEPNTQAALIPAGGSLPQDAASFLSIGASADLAPRWDGFGNIELTVPEAARIYRQDVTVADIAVVYR